MTSMPRPSGSVGSGRSRPRRPVRTRCCTPHASVLLRAFLVLAAASSLRPCIAQDFGKIEFNPEDGKCGDSGPWMQEMCSSDAEGNESEFCEPCLVGPEWDALRAELGTNLIQGHRSARPMVKYAQWMTQTLQSSAFRIILKELLGYDVVQTASTTSVFELEEAASDSCRAINLEVWYTEPDVEVALINDGKLVLSDFMGCLGQEGLYFPSHMPLELLRYESLTVGESAAELLAQFPADGSVFSPDKLDQYYPDGSPWGCDESLWSNSTCVAGRWYPPQCGETYPSANCAELYIPVSSFSAGWWESVVANLGLNFSVVYTSQDGLTDRLEEIYSNKLGGLFYWWAPDPLLLKYPAIKLSVPLHNPECYNSYNYDPLLSGVDCSRNILPLRKVMNADQAANEPDIGNLFKSWYFSTEQLNELLAFQADGGGASTNPYRAACQWLKSSDTTVDWRSWVQISDPCAGREPVHVLDEATGTCVAAELSGASPDSESSLPFPWWWIALGVAGCIIVAVAIAFLIMKVCSRQSFSAGTYPPGKGSQVTIVVTDIEASTSLWDLYPDQVARGIAVHHQCLRSSLQAFRGYEVATEGDSFKVAFHTPEDAICWATQIQLDLLCAPWDAELEELGTRPLSVDDSGWASINMLPKTKEEDPLPDSALETPRMRTVEGAVQLPVFPTSRCASTAFSQEWASKAKYGCVRYDGSKERIPVFRGMRVRVGMHTGIAEVVGTHELTKRVTYGGKVTELAKAVSETACGGQIIMSGETLAAISSMQDFLYRVSKTFKLWRSELDPRDKHRCSLAIVHCGSHMLQHSAELTETSASNSFTPADHSAGLVPARNKSRTEILLAGAQQKLVRWGSSRFPAAADLPKKIKYMQELLMVVPEPLRARVRCYPKLKTEEAITPSYFDAPDGTDTTIMFTYIQAWNTINSQITDKAVLKSTITQYALLVRSCLVQHKGYEVEGEEDSFVCAFSNPMHAVSCAIDIQGRMLSTQWPLALLKNKHCQLEAWSDGTHRLKGPRIKIGMCTGKASKSQPCLRTGRRLYFGSLMNHAARVTSKASGGQVLLHQKTYSKLDTNRLDPSICVTKLTKVELKGIKNPITIYEARVERRQSAQNDEEEEFAPAEQTMTARKFLAKYLDEDCTADVFTRTNSLDLADCGESTRSPVQNNIQSTDTNLGPEAYLANVV